MANVDDANSLRNTIVISLRWLEGSARSISRCK